MEQKRRNQRAAGAAYEKAAGFFLEQQGYEILKYNYRCRAGEIDIIAKDGECLVFCEVKYRSGKTKGSPLEAVTWKKQKTLVRCALCYLTEQQTGDLPCRFDVIGIEQTKIMHVKNAFTC